MKDGGEFRTSDLWLCASVSAATGCSAVRVERTPGQRRATFVLRGAPGAERLAEEFRSRRLCVNAHSLMEAIRTLKRELYDGEGGGSR